MARTLEAFIGEKDALAQCLDAHCLARDEFDAQRRDTGELGTQWHDLDDSEA